jgi:hypothetical protein
MRSAVPYSGSILALDHTQVFLAPITDNEFRYRLSKIPVLCDVRFVGMPRDGCRGVVEDYLQCLNIIDRVTCGSSGKEDSG